MSGVISIIKDYSSSVLGGQSIAILGNEICLPTSTPNYELLDKITGASSGVTALTIGGNNWVISDGVSFYISSTGGGGDGGITQVGGGITHTGIGTGPFGMGVIAGTVFSGGRDSGSLYTPAGGVFPVAASGLASTCPTIVLAGGFMWAVQNNGVHDILWKLTISGEVVGSFALPFHALGMTTDNASLWITDAFNGKIQQVNFAGSVIASYNTFVAEPGRIIYDGSYLWVGDITSGFIEVFDLAGVSQDFKSVGSGTIQDFTLDGTDVWLTYQNGATITHAAKVLFTPDVPPVSPKPSVVSIDSQNLPHQKLPHSSRYLPTFRSNRRSWLNFP